MNNDRIDEVFRLLEEAYQKHHVPYVTEVAEKKRDPFKVLISCIISLRTKDETTRESSVRLFKLAENPGGMLKLSKDKIAGAVYPAGFYNVKAENILAISKDLIDRFGGKVPDTIDELLSLKGVGRKTANLVVTLGYGKPGICVDTHVHRISNRFGYVVTKTPDKTEFALREKLPGKYWIRWNDLLVSYGQNICAPISPKCSICCISGLCEKVGVTTSR